MRAHPAVLKPGRGKNAHVSFDAAELKLPRLGYMENNVLQQALWQALEAPEGDAARSGLLERPASS